jgi:hypothetical protein
MAYNNDGPGKRLKREEAKNTLYVKNPNDPRLRAYRDSLSLYKEGLNPFIHFYDYGSGEDLQPKENYVPKGGVLFGKNDITKADIIKDIQGIKDELVWQENKNVRKNLGDRLGLLNKSLATGIYPTNMEYPETYTANLIYKKPERPVVYKSEKVEKLVPRQAPMPSFAPQEIVAPVMRPVAASSTPMKVIPMEDTVETIVEKPVNKKMPKSVLPSRIGGSGNQPLLMKLFPKLYER